jgi:hypothetical protein
LHRFVLVLDFIFFENAYEYRLFETKYEYDYSPLFSVYLCVLRGLNSHIPAKPASAVFAVSAVKSLLPYYIPPEAAPVPEYFIRFEAS